MITRRSALFAVTALCTVLTVTGCKDKKPADGDNKGGDTKSSASTGDTILVGEYGSMTGAQSTFGHSSDEGTRLAVDEINAAGGVNGKKIELVGPEDTESTNQKGAVAVKRLVEKKVVAVLGEVASGISLAGAPECQKAEIPMISPSSTNPKVTQVGDFIFRVCFVDPFQGSVIAKFAADTLKGKTAAIFYDAGAPYSVGIRDEFTKAFIAKGGKVIVETSYATGDKDFRSPLTKIKAANPDVILVPGYYTEAGTICKQARDLGINTPILGGDGWDSDQFHKYAGNTVTNCFFSNHMSYEDKNPIIQDFAKNYKAKYNGKQPDALAALAYDATKVLAAALKTAKSTSGKDLRDAIAATKDFDGVTGKITLNKNRDADKGAVIIEVNNGAFKYKETIQKP